jgi:Uma2 family endonuclease
MSELFTMPVDGRTAGNREIFARERIPADSYAKNGRRKSKSKSVRAESDRPGWIPREIRHNWNTCPYAYQTEEELMPAGGAHGELLIYLGQILENFLKKKGLGFLADTFMIYRDAKGVRQRVAPDLLIMPLHPDPPSAYNLDTEPPPAAAVEITSPKSRSGDMKKKAALYGGLGISAYLVIDHVTDRGDLREQIDLHLWRKTGENLCRMPPDAQGWLTVPEMKTKIKAQGRKLLLQDMDTGKTLHDNAGLEQIAELERQRAERLAEKLRALGISPEEI